MENYQRHTAAHAAHSFNSASEFAKKQQATAGKIIKRHFTTKQLFPPLHLTHTHNIPHLTCHSLPPPPLSTTTTLPTPLHTGFLVAPWVASVPFFLLLACCS